MEPSRNGDSNQSSSLVRCIENHSEAKSELKRIANRTTGRAQNEAIQVVEEIIANVRDQGDEAIVSYTRLFDGFNPKPLKVTSTQIKQAWQDTPKNLQSALKLAHRRIENFHQHQKPKDIQIEGTHGETIGRRWLPVQKAGIYIPGGRAAYPSTVLMNSIPAKVAGVEELIMVSPAGADGLINRTVLAAAHLAGVNQIFRVGGAQAIAGLAFGTETIPKVDVISGPGNLYVTLAKKAVYGQVGIDSLAGPSEVLIIADRTAEANQIATDLLAQAEHDPLASSILITTDKALAKSVQKELKQQLQNHPRQEICEKSLRNWGLIIICHNMGTCIELSDLFAPEHLELITESPKVIAEKVKHAGAIFIGKWTPEAVGDYLAGPNHTLPTSGTARFSGALSTETFLKHTSLMEFNRCALEETSNAVIELAKSEGLYSHSKSVEIRLAAKERT